MAEVITEVNLEAYVNPSLMLNPEPLITHSNCLEECRVMVINYKYGFIWLFVIGFVFNQAPLFIMNLKNLTPKLRANLIYGSRFAGYLLQVAGIVWFMVVLLS